MPLPEDKFGSPDPPPHRTYVERTGLAGSPPSAATSASRAADEEILRQEYFQLQTTIESFDAKTLTIKAWSVTLSMAGIGAAYFQAKPVVLLLAAFSAFLFWIIEALWKTFQYAFYQRVYTIERYFSGETDTITAPRIAHAWSQSWHAGGTRRLMTVMMWPHVLLPHAVVAVGGVVLYFIHLKWGGI